MLNIAIFLWYAIIYRALLTVIHHIFWTILILTKYNKTQVNILDMHQIISFSCPLQIYSIIYQWWNDLHVFSYAQSPKSFIEWHPEVKVLLSAYRKWNCPVLSCLMYATSLVTSMIGRYTLLNSLDVKRRICIALPHDDVIKWKHFPHYWPCVRRISRSLVNLPHKG